MRRLFVLLVICLFFTSLNAQDESVDVDGIYYSFNNSGDIKTAEVTSNPNKYTGDVIIPVSVTYNEVLYSITSIGSSAFYGCTDLTSVKIPESVTLIGSSAFEGCSALVSVTIGSGVTEIFKDAFLNCNSLNAVYISDLAAWCNIVFRDEEYWRGGANPLNLAHHLYLNGEEVRDLVIPSTVNVISDRLFLNCSELTSVKIEESVTKIGAYAFSGCENITTVEIPNSVTEIGSSAFYGCSAMTSISLGSGVTSIGADAFRDCSGLASFTIPNGVKAIDYGTFGGCSNLLSVEIPEGVETIGEVAFVLCESLANVVIPEGVISIGEGAFQFCGITSLSLPKSLKSLARNAFLIVNKIKEVKLSDLTTWFSISLDSNSNPLSLAQHVYVGDKELTDLVIPDGVTSISNGAFKNCEWITSLTLPNGFTKIDENSFCGCTSLASLSLPESITIIKGNAFNGCSKLESLIIPSKVEYIYQQAFANCGNLQSVKSLAETPPFLYDNSFSNYEIPLYVPEGAREAYQGKEPWNKFKVILSGADTKYTLTYKVDGEVYKTYDLLEGTAITPEAEPTKEGYDFSGWSTIPATMPAEDVTITGTFTLLTDEDEITIKDIGKTTWCSKYDLDFTNVEGIKAYTATGYNNITKTIWLTRVMEVPAGTGILVKGDAGTYKIPHAEVQSAYANWFVGNLGETISISATDGDKTNYYLSGKDGTFKSVNGSANIGKNKAYLQLPTSVFGGTRSIGINYDDEDGTTSIKNLTPALTEGEGEWYTLQGQRVAKPGKGLYIRNGKKVIVR